MEQNKEAEKQKRAEKAVELAAELKRKKEVKKFRRVNLYFFRTLCDVAWKKLSYDNKNFYDHVVFIKTPRFNGMLRGSMIGYNTGKELDDAQNETGINRDVFCGSYMVGIEIMISDWDEFFQDRESMAEAKKSDKTALYKNYFKKVSEFKKKLRDLCNQMLNKNIDDIIDYDVKCIVYYVKFKRPYSTRNVLEKYEYALKTIEGIRANDLKHFDDGLLKQYEVVLGQKYDLVKAFNTVKAN